jgi:hypothetical protein
MWHFRFSRAENERRFPSCSFVNPAIVINNIAMSESCRGAEQCMMVDGFASFIVLRRDIAGKLQLSLCLTN